MFFVAADPGGEGFEAVAELVDLDGEAGERDRVLAMAAVLGHDGGQLSVSIDRGPADPRARRDRVDADHLARCEQVTTGLIDSSRPIVGHYMTTLGPFPGHEFPAHARGTATDQSFVGGTSA